MIAARVLSPKPNSIEMSAINVNVVKSRTLAGILSIMHRVALALCQLLGLKAKILEFNTLKKTSKIKINYSTHV